VGLKGRSSRLFFAFYAQIFFAFNAQMVVHQVLGLELLKVLLVLNESPRIGIDSQPSFCSTSLPSSKCFQFGTVGRDWCCDGGGCSAEQLSFGSQVKKGHLHHVGCSFVLDRLVLSFVELASTSGGLVVSFGFFAAGMTEIRRESLIPHLQALDRPFPPSLRGVAQIHSSDSLGDRRGYVVFTFSTGVLKLCPIPGVTIENTKTMNNCETID